MKRKRLDLNLISSLVDSHIIDYPTAMNFYYNWSFVSSRGFCPVIRILSGAFLAMYYTGKTQYAFLSKKLILLMSRLNLNSISKNKNINLRINTFFNMSLKVFLPIVTFLFGITNISESALDHYESFLDRCAERERVASDADLNRKCRLMEVEALTAERKVESVIRLSHVLEQENARELKHAANLAKINNEMLGSTSNWNWLYIVTGFAGLACLGIYFYYGDIPNILTTFGLISDSSSVSSVCSDSKSVSSSVSDSSRIFGDRLDLSSPAEVVLRNILRRLHFHFEENPRDFEENPRDE